MTPDGEEGIPFDRAVIHFVGDAPDSEREIEINSPRAFRIAEKIVSAVNSHDALVKALEEACDLLAERKYGSPARSPGHNARLVLDAAISLAKGQNP